MQPFSAMPIRTKLIRLVVTTCGIVLLFAISVLVVAEIITTRRFVARSVGILGQTVAVNTAAALAFEVPEDADQVLDALRADQYVNYAALFNSEGHLFARYPAETEPIPVPPDLLGEGVAEFSDGFFHYAQPVGDRDTRWGTLYIRYDLGLVRQRLIFDLMMGCFVLGGAVAASYLIASIIQRSVSMPLVKLARVARRISREHNFDLRAEKYTADEVGDLTDAFNEMLNELGQKEVALRRSEERLRLAVGASQTGIWDLNLETGEMEVEGHVFEVVAPGRRSLTLTEMITRHVHPEDRPKVEGLTSGKGQFLDATYRVILPDGSIRYYYSRGNAWQEREEAAAHLLGVTIDVTAAREAEEEIIRLNRDLEQRVVERTAELRNALHEIESFSYSVSHDLRAPLRSIDGFSRILLAEYESKVDEEGKDFLRRIRVSAQKMGQLIEDLLKLSRVTRQEMKRAPVNLSELVAEIFAEINRPGSNRKVRFEVEPEMRGFGDENLLRIALHNLIGNAWKFTSRKQEARIEVGRIPGAAEQTFFVRDNGAGFNMEHGGKLFGAFQRLHGASEFEGTGVGLATVKRIINRHGGTIWAEAEVDAGATFYFTLPDRTEDELEEFNTAGGR